MEDDRPSVDASKLSTIRMKLEEKRRHIEQEKRKYEIALSRQQQQVGKAAFLQAINKVRGFLTQTIIFFPVVFQLVIIFLVYSVCNSVCVFVHYKSHIHSHTHIFCTTLNEFQSNFKF